MNVAVRNGLIFCLLHSQVARARIFQGGEKALKKLVIWSISNFLYICRRSSFSFRLIYCMATSFGAASQPHHINVIFSLNLLRSVLVLQQKKKTYWHHMNTLFIKSLMKMILIEANLPIIISEHVWFFSLSRSHLTLHIQTTWMAVWCVRPSSGKKWINCNSSTIDNNNE